jgi:hypothetical protein
MLRSSCLVGSVLIVVLAGARLEAQSSPKPDDALTELRRLVDEQRRAL